MNAETRAKELMRQFYAELEYVSATHADDMERRIAAAIRQAENDKLEEAAAWLDNRAAFYEARASEAIDAQHADERMFGSGACTTAAYHIRSLKSKDTP